MPRRLSALLALFLGGALTACAGGGSGTAAPSGSPSQSSSPSPSPSPVDVTVAGPPAAAKINLQAADLPADFKASPAADEDSAEDEAAGKELSACVGQPFAESLVSEVSDDFVKGEEFSVLEYASQVEFYADEAVVAADLMVSQGDKIGACLSRQFTKEIKANVEGVKLSPIVVTRLAPVAQGADGAFGLRFSTKAIGPKQSIPFTFDVLGFAKDRTEVSLTVSAFGAKPNDVERDALFAKLVERGLANAL